MEFRVIDRRTNDEVSEEVISQIAKDAGNLIVFDIDEFALTESGQLLLLDDCGNVAYVNDENLEIKLVN